VATLIIRNIEHGLLARLKESADVHGRCIEEEALCILREHLTLPPSSPTMNFGDAIRALFEPLGGLDLPEIEREPVRDPPDFSGPEWDFPE
jgi:antitoxin FitA